MKTLLLLLAFTTSALALTTIESSKAKIALALAAIPFSETTTIVKLHNDRRGMIVDYYDSATGRCLKQFIPMQMSEEQVPSIFEAPLPPAEEC